MKDGQLEKSRPSLQDSLISHDQCPHSGCSKDLVRHIFDSEGRASVVDHAVGSRVTLP